MSVQAYQTAAANTESPRQTEYRAFAVATRGLIDAAALPVTEIGRRIEALSKNRRLWTLLAVDCSSDGNQLPKGVRAQIISLSIFVDKHSSQVIRQGASMDILIDINRTMMQGLASANGAASPAHA
ncbi:MAG: flagellar biosynthesis regulator FlaF [Alphaproteobacteria bacterium]